MTGFHPQFFDMQRHDAVRALEIYRKAGQQASFWFNYAIQEKNYFLSVNISHF